MTDWAKSLKGQLGPDGHPYSPDSVHDWSGGLVSTWKVGNLWQKMPQVHVGGAQQGPGPLPQEREQWLEKMVAFQPGANGASTLKEFLETQRRPEWMSLKRRARKLNEQTWPLVKDWAREKVGQRVASGRGIWSLSGDVAKLSGGLISQSGVFAAWREDAGGSQPRSGQLPEGSGAPNEAEIEVLSHVALGESDTTIAAPMPGGQGVGVAGVDALDRAGAMASGDDGPPLLNYVAFGEDGADHGRLEVDLGGRVLFELSEGWENPFPQDIEMTGTFSPQHSSPDVTGMGGIDASDPGPAAVFEGSAVGAGAGLVRPGAQGVGAAEIGASDWAGAMPSGGGSDGSAGGVVDSAPPVPSVGVPVDRSLLSALVAENPAGVRELLGPVLDGDLVGFLSDPDEVRAELGRAGEPDGERLAQVTELLQVRVGHWLVENRAGLPAEVLRQRVFLPYLGQRARELQEQDP
ncbi:hypothetical protein, partial [Micromonospora sp. NPDC048830]|uniref:hypothetical protein n=1 Tax=Micromonospora sp. NPDC048830 TaxID=3364257 RepID=UPI003716AF20